MNISWLHAAASLGLAYLGMLGLCLGMARHYRQRYHHPLTPGRGRVLRLAGWSGCLLALAPCLAGWGAAQGVVLWIGLLSAAATGLVFLLAWRPPWCTRGSALAVLAVLAWLGSLVSGG